MPRPLTTLLVAASLLTLAGCKPPSSRFYVTDNFSPELLGSEDDVAEVYALGSQLTFDVGEKIAFARNIDMTGWTLVSSDPSVVELVGVHGDAASLSAEGSAVGVGSAELLLVDDAGETVHEVSVEVEAPDDVTLVSKLGTDVGSGFEPTSPQKVCTGDYSAFEARFSAGGRSLASAQVLGAEGDDTTAVRVEDSALWESREWLSVWPTVAGEESVSVLASGEPVADVAFSAVDEGDIVGLQVLGNTTGVGVESDETVTIGAVGLDAAGEMVLGVTPTWIMPDGTEMVGDELEYTVDTTAPPVDVTVRFGTVETTTSIAGRPTGASDSSAIGCASVQSSPALGLALAGLALARRYSPRAAFRIRA